MEYPENTYGEFSPSDIVAMVNGEALFRNEFESRVDGMLAAYQAEDRADEDEEISRTVREEALEAMIAEALLRQGADLEGIEVSEDELAAGYEQVLEEFGNDKEEMLRSLEELGKTEDDLLASILTRLKVQRYVETHAPFDDMEVTDEDIAASYRNYTEGVADAPPFEKIAEDIREELERQRAQQAVFLMIEDLKKGGEIEVFIDL